MAVRKPQSATLALVLLLAIPRSAHADDTEKERFLADERGVMTVLAGWSLGSVSAGMPMITADSAQVRHAGYQNLAWGAIDGGLAIAGFVSAYRASTESRPESDWRADRASLHRIFAINVALDVLYVAAGTSLVLFGKSDELRGAGAGVLAQGTFLLGFDAAGTFVMRARR